MLHTQQLNIQRLCCSLGNECDINKKVPRKDAHTGLSWGTPGSAPVCLCLSVDLGLFSFKTWRLSLVNAQGCQTLRIYPYSKLTKACSGHYSADVLRFLRTEISVPACDAFSSQRQRAEGATAKHSNDVGVNHRER